MKTAWHISYPSLSGIERVFSPIRPLLGLARDVAKTLYLVGIQICTRLFYLERSSGSAISLSARLDVMPRARHHERHTLRVGRKSLIEASAVVCTWHGDVILGDGAHVGIGSIVIGPVRMGENSACGQHCFISGQSHRYEDLSVNFLRQGSEIALVVIGKDVWIGSNCVILPGVKIGDHAVIGAGSTVVEDIAPRTVAVGKPARIIKQYNSRTEQWQRV